jgi:hypothetical protein
MHLSLWFVLGLCLLLVLILAVLGQGRSLQGLELILVSLCTALKFEL